MKKTLGPINALYPSLTVLLGSHVDGRPNFSAIAHVGILNHGQPQYISFGVNKAHHTNRGVIENSAFSVNIPSQDLVVETDYCGLVSGKKTDKSGLFELFYGDTPAAPMIKACPVCMECVLHDVLDYKTHNIFVGEIRQVHAEESVLADGAIDPARLRPLLFDMGLRKYWSLGPAVGDCWSIGKQMKKTSQGA